jgi:hypothetical protein
MEPATLSPFKVTVTVHYATGLAIADILSSDPYVLVYVGDKVIGRTKTVYANHLNPAWEQSFEYPLLHLQHTVRLKVFDEDQNKHDDFMGMTVVDLSELPVDLSTPLDARLKDTDNTNETKGTLRFTVKIEQSKDIVKVIETKIGSKEKILAKDSNSEVVNVIQAELKAVGIDDSDPVQDAILESPIVANHTTLLSKYMVRDLLHDVFSLTVPSSVDGVEAMFPGRVRTCLQAVSSTTMDLASHRCSPAVPVSRYMLSIQCFPSVWETVPDKTINIEFTNRYATWMWAMYIRLAVDYWRDVLILDELPSFVQEGNFILQTTIPVTVTVSNQSFMGILALNFANKFQILCESVETREVLTSIDITAVRDLNVSVDSSIPKKYTLMVRSISLRLAKKLARQSSDSSMSLKAQSEDSFQYSPQAPLEEPKKAKKMFPLLRKVSKLTMSLGSAVVGTATEVVSDGASAAGGLAVDAAKFATSSAATAVRTIASADAVSALSAVTNVKDVGLTVGSTVFGAGSTVVNAVNNIHHGTFLQNIVHLTIRAGEKIVTLESKPYADEVEWRDVELDFDVAEGELSSEDSQGVELMLFRGQTGAEAPVACKFVPFTYFSKKIESNKGRVPIKIGGMLGLRVTLLKATGIKPQPVFRQASYCMYASCKCVKWNAAGRGIKFPSVKSKPLPAACELNWVDEDLVLLYEHGIEWAQYIRVQLLHGHVLSGQKQSLGSTSLGVIYIPFTDFSNSSKTRTFALYDKDTSEPVGGELTVSFRRIQDEIDSDQPKAFLDCALDEDDTVSWAAQAILSGGVEEKLTAHEDFSLCPSFQGLLLTRFATLEVPQTNGGSEARNDLDEDHPGDETRLTSMDMAPRSNSLEMKPSLLGVETNGVKYSEVFENERRAVRPPFSFGPGNLFIHPHFSDFSGKLSICNSIDDIKPPIGCEWEGPWVVDRSHTKTDEDGWSYAISYDYLVSNCLGNTSHATATGRASRRRKHRRAYREVTVQGSPRVMDAASAPTNNAGSQIATSSRMRRGSSILDVSAVTGAVTGVVSGAVSGVSNALGSHFSRGPEHSGDQLTRADLFANHPELVVNLCKERVNVYDEQVIIPWTQVITVEEVTESTLFIRARIHRYFGLNAAGEDVYHLADVDFFIFNCPSKLLKTLSAERIAVFGIRRDVMRVISAGTIDAGLEEEKSEEQESVPQTVDLSLGSHVAAQLDVDLLSLADEIKASAAANSPTELASLQFRECRLRLYIASLLRANIKGRHEFKEAETDRIIAADFDSVRKIFHETDVATANNRIEFLLDAAETHLRDAALCGWFHRQDGKLKRFIERIVNAYLVEMVSLLGKFFDDNKTIRQVKGLTSKTQLIMTFMRHNDRLGQLLDSALRPYNLSLQPRPQLQLFLKIDTLVGWYSAALEQEMFSHVDNVVRVSRHAYVCLVLL